MYNGGSIYTSQFSVGHINNSGTISASDYSSDTTINSGTISTYTYIARSDTSNSGTLSTVSFSCPKTKNTGEIQISTNNTVNLGTFDLIEKGQLNLNGIIIKANETIAEDVKQFLEKSGGTIIQTENFTTLKGNFCVNRAKAKIALPHLFSKYDEAKRGSEYIPSNWFSNGYDRVASISKKTGLEKIWRVTPITENYTLKTATADVFNGKLLHAIVRCDFVPKTKFDVFNKAVVARDFSKENTCSLKNEINGKKEKRNHDLIVSTRQSHIADYFL